MSIDRKLFFFLLILHLLIVLILLNKEKILFGSNLAESGLSYLPSKDKHHIFLIWKGSSFPDIYLKALTTVIKFHPKSEILLFSNDLNESFFEDLNLIYKNLFIVRYNLTQMVKNKPGYNFVEKANRILNGEKSNLTLTKVHLSDFLRLFLVYNYGGLYLDTDMFPLRNMQSFKNTIGVDDQYKYVCGKNIYSYKNVSNFGCVCNCLFSFEKGHEFLKSALDNFGKWWEEKQGYGPGGAIMLTELLANHLDKVNVIPNEYWICLKYGARLLKLANEGDPDIEYTLKKCYVVHLFGAGAASFSLNNFDQLFIGKIYKKLI
ncbi:unnamed protein product [Brachionus calyciflorus]|uniref:Alpha-1,4-N-acetylglucosaminyltransferase n=1 Tax=Brachionus calyciflorus TaxID=104777 RepID=A0A813S7D1_9BILA|nr:unnamed protein product [Brachionus calyciflorus]